MQRGIRMRVVEIERMAERAVEQRGYRRGPGLAVTEYGGLAGAIQRQRFEHFQQRRRGFGVSRGGGGRSGRRGGAESPFSRGNPASAPWRAPAPHEGFCRSSGRECKRRAL